MSKINNIIKLYLSFAKIGTFTFGGGLAMMPMMQKELIEKKGWITEDELIDYYAVGQSTPGIVAINVATFVGYKIGGVLGGIFATLGVVTPSLVIIMILAGAISSISDYPIVQKALQGINVSVAALLTYTVVNLGKKSIKNIWNLVFAIIAFILVFIFKAPTVVIILSSLVVGVLITYFKLRKVKEEEFAGDEK